MANKTKQQLLKEINQANKTIQALQLSEQKHVHNEKVIDVLFQISNAANLTENLNELYQSIHESLKQIMDVKNFFYCFV